MSSEAARYFSTFDSAAVAQEQRTAPAPSDQLTDEALLARISTGDKEALADLFRRFGRVVHTVAFRILNNSAEADDLLQDLFVFIYRKCTLFDSSKSSARSWVVQMAYHRAIDRRRYLQSRHFYSNIEIDDEITQIPDPHAGTNSYDHSLEGMLGREGARQLFELLSVDQRQTLQMLFFDGFTFDEIATKLNQSIGNVRNHYYRGLEKIRHHVFPKKLRVR